MLFHFRKIREENHAKASINPSPIGLKKKRKLEGTHGDGLHVSSAKTDARMSPN